MRGRFTVSALTGRGPSSKPAPHTPSGASQIQSFLRHLYVVEQTSSLIGSSEPYVGLPPVIVDTGMSGILPALTAAESASTHSCGSLVTSGLP